MTANEEQTKPLAALVALFLQRKRLRPKSARDYRRYLDEFVAFTNGGDATALTLDAAIRWRHELLGRSDYVAKIGTSILKSFAVWCAQAGHRRDAISGRSVLLGLDTMRMTARRRHALTDDQLDAVWVALAERENRDRLRGIAYVRLLHATGLRSADVRAILRRNVDVRSRWLTAAVHRRAGTEIRRFRLSRTCVVAIEEYLAGSLRPKFRDEPPEPLLITEDGEAFTDDGFTSWVGRVAKDIQRLTGIPWNSGAMAYTWKVHFQSKIRDPELRRRCADLLGAESDHDRAISAATTVLRTECVTEVAGWAASVTTS
jgi:integrase